MTRDIAAFAIGKLPETIRQLAYNDAGLCQRLGIETVTRVMLGADAYERRASFETVRRAIDSGRPQVMDTLAGEQASIRAYGGRRAYVIVTSGRMSHVMRRLELLSADQGKRRRRLERLLDAHDLPEAAASDWRDRCNRKSLTPDELDALNRDLRNTPRGVAGSLRQQRIRGELSLDLLIPAGRRYYERLISLLGDCGNGPDCTEMLIAAVCGAPDAGVVRLLPLLLPVPQGEQALLASSAEEVSEERLRRLVRSAGLRSDPFTCAAGLEIACARPDARNWGLAGIRAPRSQRPGTMDFPVPIPVRPRDVGNGNWEVGAPTPVSS